VICDGCEGGYIFIDLIVSLNPFAREMIVKMWGPSDERDHMVLS
jgi:hypothetical protein